jgi:hypothetical protein
MAHIYLFLFLGTKVVGFENNYYITVNVMLTQPDAEAYCSKTYKNGTLYSFEDGGINVTENYYWTGFVYNERTTEYEFGNGTEITFAADQIGGRKNDRKLCVVRKNPGTSIKFHTSKCCETVKNFICKSPQEQAINGNYCFLHFLLSLLSFLYF